MIDNKNMWVTWCDKVDATSLYIYIVLVESDVEFYSFCLLWVNFGSFFGSFCRTRFLNGFYLKELFGIFCRNSLKFQRIPSKVFQRISNDQHASILLTVYSSFFFLKIQFPPEKCIWIIFPSFQTLNLKLQTKHQKF